MTLKNKLRNNKITIGSWIMIDSPICIEVMAMAGFEWLVIDLEHTSIDLKTTENLIRTIQANNMSALVRVSKNEEVIIKRVLDMGADGIIVPMICSREDALQTIEFAKYPPQGKRGVGLYRASKYGKNFEGYKKWVKEELIIIAQIEHKDAVKNLDDILQVEGIDGTLIGPYDLSMSLGHPGEFQNNEVKKSLKEVVKKCQQHQVPSGFHLVDTDPSKLKTKLKQGFTFVAFGIDYLFLRDLTKSGMKKIQSIIS